MIVLKLYLNFIEMVKNIIIDKELLSIPSVGYFFIKDNWLYASFYDNIEVFSLTEKGMESKFKIINTNGRTFNSFNKKLIAQDRSSIKIYDENGEFLGKNYRFPHLGSAQVFKQKLIFQTYDQLRNEKIYLTELDLETIEMVEWEWKYSSYDEIVGFFNNNLLVFSYDYLNSKKYYLKYINKKTFEVIWEVCLDEFNPKIATRINTKFKILNETVVFSVGDLFVCLDIHTGKKIWQTDNLGFPHYNTVSYSSYFFIYWKDQAFCIPRVGDYIVIDLITGKEKVRIKNWSESLPYKPHIGRWIETIKIYDDFFMIPEIELGTYLILIHFFDKQTGKEIYKVQLGKDKVLGWSRENLEYYDGKLYVSTTDNEESNFTFRIFELNLENVL